MNVRCNLVTEDTHFIWISWYSLWEWWDQAILWFTVKGLVSEAQCSYYCWSNSACEAKCFSGREKCKSNFPWRIQKAKYQSDNHFEYSFVWSSKFVLIDWDCNCANNKYNQQSVQSWNVW